MRTQAIQDSDVTRRQRTGPDRPEAAARAKRISAPGRVYAPVRDARKNEFEIPAANGPMKPMG
jgi:hypothetical protein